jgi:hypothetical protein
MSGSSERAYHRREGTRGKGHARGKIPRRHLDDVYEMAILHYPAKILEFRNIRI